MTIPDFAMIILGLILIYLAIAKKYEPLLLLPIGFGTLLVNLPLTNLMAEGALFNILYWGVKSGLFPPLIFLGIGAMTDFSPLLSNPKTLFLGAAAQIGIFITLFGAVIMKFSIQEASAIAIIGGADGPTSIFVTALLAPELLGPIAVAAYSYMALVPIIQPPIIKLLTTKKERLIKMQELETVSKKTKILFPIITSIIAALIIPASAPLIGMLMLGNLFKESGVVDRLVKTSQNELINIITIPLGISVGATMTASTFLTLQTLFILFLGLLAFAIGTASGVIFAKIMCVISKGKINPMIGAAGVSAVPMAARVVQKMGLEENPNNHLLMHAMGPNVAGVIGSAAAAGVLITLVSVF
jgi:carboxybiotin decarboxylase